MPRVLVTKSKLNSLAQAIANKFGVTLPLTLSGMTSTIENLPTKSAETITPSTSSQTIAAGTYLSGAQTIQGDANLVASNIAAGTSVFGISGTFTSDATASAANISDGLTAYINGQKITGTLSFQNIYTGTTEPSSSTGKNGDIYVQL